jgi:hypothetical protein
MKPMPLGAPGLFRAPPAGRRVLLAEGTSQDKGSHRALVINTRSRYASDGRQQPMKLELAVNSTEVNKMAAATYLVPLLIGFGFAYWTGSIAARKGRHAVRWGVFGFCLGLVALLVAYSVPSAKQPAFD